jgi:hypothetical protein
MLSATAAVFVTAGMVLNPLVCFGCTESVMEKAQNVFSPNRFPKVLFGTCGLSAADVDT